YNQLGQALMRQRKLDEAIAAFREAIRIDPKFALAYNNLGRALNEQKKVPEAVDAYRKAIATDPKFADAHNNLGALLCDGKRDYEGAPACFNNVIDLTPQYTAPHYNL